MERKGERKFRLKRQRGQEGEMMNKNEKGEEADGKKNENQK